MPAALKDYMNTVITSISSTKNTLFPRHFILKDAIDQLKEFLEETVGVRRTIDFDFSNWSPNNWLKRNLRMPKVFISDYLRYLIC